MKLQMADLQGYWDYDTYWATGVPEATDLYNGAQQYCTTKPSQTNQTQTIIRDLGDMYDTFKAQLPEHTPSHTDEEKCKALDKVSKAQKGYNPYAIRWDSEGDTCQVVTRPYQIPSLCIQRTLAGGYNMGPVDQTYCGETPPHCEATAWYGRQVPEPSGPDPNWYKHGPPLSKRQPALSKQ